MNDEQRAGKTRPSLTGTDPLQEIEKVLDARRPLYEKAASLVVDTNSMTVSKVAESIVKGLPERS